MTIIELMQLERSVQLEWGKKIAKSDWDAGGYLARLVMEDEVEKAFGSPSRILMLTDGDSLVCYCTLVPFDEIPDDTKKPWIGFVYTFPEYRGHRYAGVLIEEAKRITKNEGYGKVFVSSDEIGLYEKYGFHSIGRAQSIHEYETGIFECSI
ncbi:MAG: GNAT family N-acetyltransferase [Clostridiales bacterium]|nr:GNAT family N-acetyltransferase [Clostridiales bacterium]